FDCLIELPRCTCHAAEGFKKHNKLLKLMQFLMGLDDSYMSIRSSILSKDPLPDVKSAYAAISSEESHRVMYSSMAGTSQRSQTSAFPSNVSNRTNFQRGQTSNNNFRPNNANNAVPRHNNSNVNMKISSSGLVYNECGYNGHTSDRCFKIIGYPVDFGKKKNGQNFNKKINSNNTIGSNTSSGFTDDQLSTLISLIKDNTLARNDVQANMTGTYFNNSKVFNDNFNKFFCSNANQMSKLVSSGKIVDSGANQHMTNNDKELDNVHDISHLKIKVSHPNGTEAIISKIGNLMLPNGLTLVDVLVIPEYCVTLISVHKLAKDNKIFVAIDENICYFLNQDLNLKNVLGIGNQCGGLYYLDLEDPVLVVLKPELNINNIKQAKYCEIWGIPLRFWTATYLINRLFSSVLNGKSPFEMIYKTKPNLFILRVFGCSCFATVLNNHDKLGSRSEKCVMMGYSNAKKGYRLYSLDKHQFIYSRDVRFFETVFPFKDSSLKTSESVAIVFQDVNHLNFFYLDYHGMPNDEESVDPSPNGSSRTNSDSGHSPVLGETVETDDIPDTGIDVDISNHPHETQDEKVTTLEENMLSEGNVDVNPSSSSQASKQSHWTDAMNKEMSALLRNDTWDIVDLPKGRKAIGSKWIWKIKFKSSGEIERYKARLVAQGFGQKERINYEETFSPVVKMTTIKCLLNIVVHNWWPTFQLDIDNAFLYGDLDEIIYMKPPQGYYPADGNKACKLKKSLYGFKQFENDDFLALLVYVDDIIITGNNVFEIEKFKDFLKSKFQIKDFGKLKYFIRIEVIDTDKGICLNQRKYMLELLTEYGMLACKPARTPMMSKLSISNEATNNDPFLDNIVDYQKLMGKLIYLTNIRSDISYVVHCLSQFMHAPLKCHLKSAFKILRYLKGSPDLGIHITRESSMSLKAYSDDDWAKCTVIRKSVTGYFVFINNNLISWKSKKQSTLSKSSTEAEYIALASVTSEIFAEYGKSFDVYIAHKLSKVEERFRFVRFIGVEDADRMYDQSKSGRGGLENSDMDSNYNMINSDIQGEDFIADTIFEAEKGMPSNEIKARAGGIYPGTLPLDRVEVLGTITLSWKPCNEGSSQINPTCSQLSATNQALLEASVTHEEIKEAVWSCSGDKASSSDGITFKFIKRYWNWLQQDIYDYVSNFFDTWIIPKGCNASFITLILKIQNLLAVKDYRPSSLLSIQYKFIAKVLATRLAKVLNEVVSYEQTTFIQGCQILDGPLMLSEIVDWSPCSGGRIYGLFEDSWSFSGIKKLYIAKFVGAICHMNDTLIIPWETLVRKVGNGSNVKFWLDEWVDNQSLKDRFNRLFYLESNKNCMINKCYLDGSWRKEWQRQIRGEREQEQLQQLLDLLQKLQLSDDNG
nr:hypothetical protein [Tanacetum cinerariifolium]